MRLASLARASGRTAAATRPSSGVAPAGAGFGEGAARAGMTEALGLLHFHMGSQISNVRDIANGMREATRYFASCRSSARRSATSTSAAASASTTKARARAASARSTTASASTPRHRAAAGRCLRGQRLSPPRIVTECGPRDDRAPRRTGGERVRGRGRAGRPRARRARRRADGDPPPARDPRRARCAPAVELSRRRSIPRRRLAL